MTMHNFTQTEPVNPTIDSAAMLTLNVAMLLEVAIVPLLIHLVVHHSSHIQHYKYFLLNNIGWCFLLTTTLWASKIHFHFPAPCVHFEPVFSTDYFNSTVYLYVFIIGVVNVLASMACTIIYRLSHAQNSRNARFFESRKHAYIAFAVFQLCSSLTFMGLLRAIQITDPVEAREELFLRLPYLAEMPYPFICVRSGFIAILISFGAAVMLVVIAVIGTVMLAVLYYKLKANRAALTERTARLQFMLFYALTIQIVNYYVLELFPMIFDCVGLTFGYAHGEATMLIVEALISIHSIVDYLCIIFFITPYRRAVGKMCRRMVGMQINPRRPSMFSSETVEIKKEDMRRGSTYAKMGNF
ncbi:unnamed protein product [Bursaphelenchus xylophilus]|uniref:(pine wood nematode) hypothetical protein n=1 Tax=Bursaphelenchus xylophilus TaxID=6326 RepID=A0A1I7RZS0_BURXY|nr:unnamed protein product [Bursaphelenchus xylophilus]CAG9111655.1 unnamed protein product [Bursaphelenchus xylophilus]